MALFRIIALSLFVLLNFGWAGAMLYLLGKNQVRSRLARVGVILWAVCMLGILALQGFSPPSWLPILRNGFYLPLSTEMVWNLLFFPAFGAIFALLVLGRARQMDRARQIAPQDLSRRRFLCTVAIGAAPATALAMGVHGTVTSDDLRVRSLEVPITNLPPELEGFTIAHVSDLHSGIFCGPDRLRKISDATNDLKADLIVVTGDVINSSIAEFDAAAVSIRRLEAPHGLYLCEGNHDLFAGEGVFAQACAESGFPLLRNSAVVLPARGRRLILGGLPWYSRGFRADPATVAALFPPRQEGDVRVVLAHHPNLFDASVGTADLMLSGHTHGGQLMIGDAGFGPLFFEYWSGLYRQGPSSLVVSNGAGDWFPCRIGAPAEIGLLKLARA